MERRYSRSLESERKIEETALAGCSSDMGQRGEAACRPREERGSGQWRRAIEQRQRRSVGEELVGEIHSYFLREEEDE
jgi:hypothetical protein